MLSIHAAHSRRSFMRIGSLGMGGLALPLLPSILKGSDGKTKTSFAKDQSVILLFLHGGPSQTETFDPKMSAPAGIRSATGEVKTSIPGVTFGASFPKLAALANQMTIVRSFASGNGNHDIKPVVGKETFDANVGSIYSRIVGTNDPESGIPKNVALFPRSVDSERQKRTSSFGKFESTGSLGKSYAPFIPGFGWPRTGRHETPGRSGPLCRIARACSDSWIRSSGNRIHLVASTRFAIRLSRRSWVVWQTLLTFPKKIQKLVARYDTASFGSPRCHQSQVEQL